MPDARGDATSRPLVARRICRFTRLCFPFSFHFLCVILYFFLLFVKFKAKYIRKSKGIENLTPELFYRSHQLYPRQHYPFLVILVVYIHFL